MKPIEDMLADKIYELVNYVLSKKFIPDIKLETVGTLTRDDVRSLKKQLGIEGVILDIDETVRTGMNKIPKCNEQWLDMLKEELKVIVVSNGIDGNVEKFLEAKGIDYIGFAHKPLKKNFRKACERLELNPEDILVIGDDTFSDIYGGRRNGMKTIRVKGVVSSEKDDREM